MLLIDFVLIGYSSFPCNRWKQLDICVALPYTINSNLSMTYSMAQGFTYDR